MEVLGFNRAQSVFSDAPVQPAGSTAAPPTPAMPLGAKSLAPTAPVVLTNAPVARPWLPWAIGASAVAATGLVVYAVTRSRSNPRPWEPRPWEPRPWEQRLWQSRAHRVTWEPVRETITTGDESKLSVTLLGILPKGEMQGLLREELEQAGWAKDPETGLLTATVEGVRVQLEADGSTVTLSKKASGTIEVSPATSLGETELEALLQKELKRGGWTETGRGTVVNKKGEEIQTRDLRVGGTSKDVKALLDKKSQDAKEALEAEVARAISRVEPDVRKTLERVTQGVYVEALRRKAQTMGQVQSVLETRGADGEYEVTIKIKV